jgi:hypothetical protein
MNATPKKNGTPARDASGKFLSAKAKEEIPVEDPPATILSRHRDSLAELKSELESVQALRLRSGALQTELAGVEIAITKLVEERLCGGSSDSELAASGNRKSSLEMQLDHLRKREHEACSSLQRRLTPDVIAMTRLGDAWIAHRRYREVKTLACLVVDEAPAATVEACHTLAEWSVSYRTALASLGAPVLLSFAWQRPLDLKSEKILTDGVIKDPLYAAPLREEIVKALLEAACRTISRWEAVLGRVADESDFELPSYEEPVPEPISIPVGEEPRKQIRGHWTEEDLKTVPWEKKGAA